MTAMPGPLSMLRLLVDPRRFTDLAHRRGLPLRHLDTGYLMHSLLGELFGERAPETFCIQREGARHVPVLAYTRDSAAQLRAHADAFANPSIRSAVDWNRFEAKTMTESWTSGQRLGFRVRACPLVRMSSAGPRHAKGAEVDAFLARCFRGGPEESFERETVYREWLAQELDRRGGAEIATLRVVRFQLERLFRRTQGAERKGHVAQRPSVDFTGELVVTEPAAFAALLARGIGRHRAFGFGMILLRAPGTHLC